MTSDKPAICLFRLILCVSQRHGEIPTPRTVRPLPSLPGLSVFPRSLLSLLSKDSDRRGLPA